MKNRPFRSFFVAAVVIGAALMVALPAPSQNAAGSAEKPAAAKKWTPPRTSWGDPDIQGWFSNRTEDATPLERPAQFEGRRLEDVKGAELAAIKRQAQE